MIKVFCFDVFVKQVDEDMEKSIQSMTTREIRRTIVFQVD